ncbi:MAG: M23 family metallopeptidase [Roseibacillus sp.]|nr:M23 family metallopeptidase [Roseibacillus sp.]
MGRGFRSEIVVGLCIFVLFLLGAIFFNTPRKSDPIQSLRSWQDADAPPGYPVGAGEDSDGRIPVFDRAFVLHDAFTRFLLPPVVFLEQPLGSERGAFTYNAQPFLEMNERAGMPHLGDDLNGIGGGNSDLGDPVYAVGNGLVVFAGDKRSKWGKVVIMGHRLPDGRLVHSLYGHLDRISVAPGAVLARGQQLGTVGTGNGAWLAHLHFEVYEGACLEPGEGYSLSPRNRIDPSALITAHRPDSSEGLAPAPLGVFEAVQQRFKLGE